MTLSSLLLSPLLLTLSTLCHSPAQTATTEPTRTEPTRKDTPNITLLAGTQHARFRWSIAGSLTPSNHDTPNVLSELSHDDLRIQQSGLNLEWAPKAREPGLIIASSAAFGVVTQGSIRDSDYDSDNRTDEYSRSYSDPDGSTTRHLTASVGWQTPINAQLTLSSHVGYALSAQRFRIRNGQQVLATQDRTPARGRLDGLDSRYNSEWQGFWSGIDLYFQPRRKERFSVRFEHHWSDYYAEADWNLREDFAHPRSFEHTAEGTGTVFRATYDRQVSTRLSLNMSASKERWWTNAGLDRLFYANGNIALTQLNEATWETAGFHIGLQYR